MVMRDSDCSYQISIIDINIISLVSDTFEVRSGKSQYF
jgi:hypothetical protein